MGRNGVNEKQKINNTLGHGHVISMTIPSLIIVEQIKRSRFGHGKIEKGYVV